MIYTRKDGTYVIEVNNMPYHVIDTDEEYWSEVQQRILDGEEIEQEVPLSPGDDFEWDSINEEWILTLEATKTNYQIRVSDIRLQRLDAGFTLGQHTIRADSYSQVRLQMYYVRHMDGVDIFPLDWRTKENVYYTILDITTFRTLISAFNTFLKTTYEDSWTVKDAIESATTIEEVETAYEGYING